MQKEKAQQVKRDLHCFFYLRGEHQGSATLSYKARKNEILYNFLMQNRFGNWFFRQRKTPNLFQMKFPCKVPHLHNKISSTFSISDHLSSTSLAKLKYFGISCSPRLMDSYCECTSEASSRGCPWKVLLEGFRIHKDFRFCNLNNNFMAEDDVRRCCRQ